MIDTSHAFFKTDSSRPCVFALHRARHRELLRQSAERCKQEYEDALLARRIASEETWPQDGTRGIGEGINATACRLMEEEERVRKQTEEAAQKVCVHACTHDVHGYMA